MSLNNNLGRLTFKPRHHNITRARLHRIRNIHYTLYQPYIPYPRLNNEKHHVRGILIEDPDMGNENAIVFFH